MFCKLPLSLTIIIFYPVREFFLEAAIIKNIKARNMRLASKVMLLFFVFTNIATLLRRFFSNKKLFSQNSHPCQCTFSSEEQETGATT